VNKYPPSNPKQKKFEEAVVDYVILDSAPLSASDGVGFRNMIKVADPQLSCPGRKMVTNMIGRKFDTVSRKLQPRLKYTQKTADLNKIIYFQIINDVRTIIKDLSPKGISMIADMWSSRQGASILGLTMQFIKNWELHNVICGFKEFEGSHTGENIRATLEEFCFKNLKIKPDQVLKFPNAFGRFKVIQTVVHIFSFFSCLLLLAIMPHRL
jgi:hypothetical protein